MERRMALAVAAAGALVSASAVVAGAMGVLGGADRGQPSATAPGPSLVTAERAEETTTSLDPVTVTETRDVYDTVVVSTLPPAAATSMASSGPTAPVEAVTSPVAPRSEAAESTDPAPTRVPATSTTTTSTVSPMPEGCIEPHLEDNGQWNCQSAESDD